MSYVPCVKNDAGGFIFYVSLVSQANGKIFQASPTFAAGDVQIAIDDGAPNNLGTLPVIDADFTKRAKVTLSQAETNGDNLAIIFSDAAGAEWCDLAISIQTAGQTLDTMKADTVEILTRLPNATAGEANGLQICGANAAATYASLTVTAALTTGSIVNNGVFTQTGAVTLSSTLATGAVTLSALTVTNNLLVSGTSTLTGNVTLSGTLGVGATTLSALTVTNNLLVSGTSTLTGNVTLSGTLGTGAVTLSALTVTNNLLISGTTVHTGNVTHTGTTTLHGAVALDSTFGVTGAVTLASLSVTGQLDAGNILVDSTVEIDSTFSVFGGGLELSAMTITNALITGSIVNNGVFTQTGAVTLSSTLTTGAVTLSALTVTNNLLISGTTTHTGNVTLSGTLGVGATTLSALTITNNLLVSGTTTHTGNVTLSGTLTAGATALASLTSTGAFSISGVSNIAQTGDAYPGVALAAAYAIVNSGMGFRGTVTGAVAGVSFTIGTLAGLGAGVFVDTNTPWYAYVLRDAGGAAGAPQGEIKKVTGYTTASGLFTTEAFSVAVAVGDDVIIQSSQVANTVAIRTTTDKLDTMTVVDVGVYQFTANALELAPTGGGTPPTVGQIADAVWDESSAAHVTAGTTGQKLVHRKI